MRLIIFLFFLLQTSLAHGEPKTAFSPQEITAIKNFYELNWKPLTENYNKIINDKYLDQFGLFFRIYNQESGEHISIPRKFIPEILPVILPEDSVIKVILRSSDEDVFITMDGQVGVRMEAGDFIEVSKSPKPISFIKAPFRSYFEVLKEKLKWGER